MDLPNSFKLFFYLALTVDNVTSTFEDLKLWPLTICEIIHQNLLNLHLYCFLRAPKIHLKIMSWPFRFFSLWFLTQVSSFESSIVTAIESENTYDIKYLAGIFELSGVISKEKTLFDYYLFEIVCPCCARWQNSESKIMSSLIY